MAIDWHFRLILNSQEFTSKYVQCNVSLLHVMCISIRACSSDWWLINAWMVNISQQYCPARIVNKAEMKLDATLDCNGKSCENSHFHDRFLQNQTHWIKELFILSWTNRSHAKVLCFFLNKPGFSRIFKLQLTRFVIKTSYSIISNHLHHPFHICA